MKIDKAIDLFEGLKTRTDRKSEIKILSKFQKLLMALKNKELSEIQLKAIEDQLSILELNTNPSNTKSFFKKKYNVLQGFLQKEFSFVPVNYYRSQYMVLGMCFGLAIGTSIGVSNDQSTGTALGLSLGMLLGLVLGNIKDKEAMKKGLILD